MGRAWLIEGGLFLAAAAFCAVGVRLTPSVWEPFEPGPRDPSLLRLVTWNVGGTGDGRGHSLDDDKVAHVASSLAALDPDVVFLQEVASRSQLEQIAAELGGDVALELEGGIGAFARRGTFRTVPSFAVRGRALSVVYEPREGAPVHVVALHAHPWSARRRNRDIGSAVDYLTTDGSAEARILCGDLNLDVDPGVRRDLFSDDDQLDVETYGYVATRFADAGLGAGPTAEPDRRLDYVFVTAGTLRPVSAGPWHGRRVGDMDHHPFVADLHNGYR